MNLKDIPKAELHRHLELAVRHGTISELATHIGLSIPDRASLAQHFLITEPMQDLGAVLDKFLNTQKLLFNTEILERITYEAIEDAYHEGIKILELRYAPTFISQGHKNLNFEQIHQAICQGQQRAEKDFSIAVGLICVIQRTLSLSQAERVVDFAIAHRDSFVGLDLADNEVGFDLRPFAPLFYKAKSQGLRITVHSGEVDTPDAPGNVQNAIEYLGAERIGHGVQIYRDLKTMNYVKSKGVVLELCPTSNWLIGAVPSKEEHPFRKLFDYGIKTTINSDDPGIFNINLTHEYQLLEQLHHFNQDEFARCNNYAAQASFIPSDKKQAVWPRPIQ